MGQGLGDGLGLWARPTGQQKRAGPRAQALIFVKLFPSWANGLGQAMGQGLGDGLVFWARPMSQQKRAMPKAHALNIGFR